MPGGGDSARLREGRGGSPAFARPPPPPASLRLIHPVARPAADSCHQGEGKKLFLSLSLSAGGGKGSRRSGGGPSVLGERERRKIEGDSE